MIDAEFLTASGDPAGDYVAALEQLAFHRVIAGFCSFRAVDRRFDLRLH